MTIDRRTTFLAAARRSARVPAAWCLRLLHKIWGPPWGDVQERAEWIPAYRTAQLEALRLQKRTGMT